MKNFFAVIAILALIGAAILGWLFFASATRFSEKKKNIYVYHQASAQSEIEAQLAGNDGIKGLALFNVLASKLHVWDKVKPGRFEINKGASLISILKMFRNNHQAEAKLIINKLRTRYDLAGILGKNFQTDSIHTLIFLSDNDSLHSLGVDTNTLMTLVIPDTYEMKWSSSVKTILSRLKDYKDAFWNKKDRLAKAKAWNLTPEQVYTLASIVEEESNTNDEKGNIASVYYNRYLKGMPLGADPTVKFALNDFGIKRILSGHLQVQSPYNTYKNKGLPPGPICTPSVKTIDAVLDMPRTSFLYFVAESSFNGRHHFSNTFEEHVEYANKYRQALDSNSIK